MSDTRKTRRAVLTTLGAAAFTAGPAYATGSAAIPVAEVKLLPSFSALKTDTSLKAGMFVKTLGYYQPGDTGAAAYRITQTAEGSSSEALSGGLFASLMHNGYVCYKMFGAPGDGRSDDGIAIKKAHIYANENQVPVINLSGEYWLKETRLIPIRTNTSWGNTIFHIDESRNMPGEPNFEILPDREPLKVTLQPAEKASLVQKLRPGTKFVPELAGYHNCLVVIKDENARIGRRYGADYNPRGWAREEFFYVEEHGRIIGDIAWTFHDYTHLTAYPCGENYLKVEGGTFLLSGDNPGKLGGPYHQGGITTRRSRTIIRDQWVGLEKERADISLTPRSGFYTFSHVYDILLENIRLVPWEKNRQDTAKTLKAGTYGIGGSRVLCGTFRNITAEGSPVHWGVFGTNLYKNFLIERCRLNRVDVHFHGWNITIRDSEIGQKGLTLTGGGELLIENTRVFHNQFVNFRQDYGAKWDGPIRIINCRGVLQTSANATVLSMRPGVFDYKYPVVFGQQIMVKDFTFVSSPSWNTAKYSLIHFPGFSASDEGGRVVFPDQVAFSNISVEGRERGLQLFELPDISGFHIRNREGGVKNGVAETNCSIHLENIVLDNTPAVPNLRLERTRAYRDSQSLYPSLTIVNCPNLNAKLGSLVAVLRIKDSLIGKFEAGSDEDFSGRILFENCRFQARLSASKPGSVFRIQAGTGISFTNCEINIPVRDETPAPEDLSAIDFLEINSALRHNHLNTRLGPDLLSYLAEKQIRLKKEFIGMMKNHHELEV